MGNVDQRIVVISIAMTLIQNQRSFDIKITGTVINQSYCGLLIKDSVVKNQRAK